MLKPEGQRAEAMEAQDESGAATLTRRALLASGGAVGIGLAVPWAAHAYALGTRSHLRRSSYLPLIGERFQVSGTHVKLRLARVEDLNRHQAGSENAFALSFTAPRGVPPLASSVPTNLHHPDLGRFKLLLTPGAAGRTQFRYWAVINRLHA